MAGAEIEENKGRAALEVITPRLGAIDPRTFATMRGVDTTLAATKLIQTGIWLKNPEIGALMGVDYSTVSQGRKRLRELAAADGKLQELLAELRVLCQG